MEDKCFTNYCKASGEFLGVPWICLIIKCHGFVAQNIYQFWPEQWDSEPILIQCAWPHNKLLYHKLKFCFILEKTFTQFMVIIPM